MYTKRMVSRPPKGEVVQGLPTKSAKIRALHAAGYKRTEIRDYLNISYQHVRNVLTAPAPQSDRGGGKTNMSDVDRARMTEISNGLSTKSAKIRALAEAGFARADIARYLEIRYQHVRNVLIADHSDHSLSASQSSGSVWRSIGDHGEIWLPSDLLAAANVRPGDEVLVRQDENGLHICGRNAAIRQAKAMIRDYIPDDASLADELIAERRAEAVREQDNG
jgi:bifunctional DNA-binding transcriptional regulator/antitoxin component of YhaV-PrlF toxin-antitoxin module